jgi:hypothetical protein
VITFLRALRSSLRLARREPVTREPSHRQPLGDARKAFAMMSTKNRIVIAIAVGVTLAGLGSAAALTFDSNRPLYEAGALAPLAEPIASEDISAGVGVFAAEPISAPTVLYIPEVTIVASVPHHP